MIRSPADLESDLSVSEHATHCLDLCQYEKRILTPGIFNLETLPARIQVDRVSSHNNSPE